jgi:hypothetical protein
MITMIKFYYLEKENSEIENAIEKFYMAYQQYQDGLISLLDVENELESIRLLLAYKQ